MKKRVLALAAGVVAAASFAMIPTASVSAGAGTWDFKSSDQVYAYYNIWNKFPRLISSGGGDYKVEITRNDTGGQLWLSLYESDDGGSTGTQIGSSILVSGAYGSSAVWSNIPTDGTDGQAELFVKVDPASSTSGLVVVNYYD